MYAAMVSFEANDADGLISSLYSELERYHLRDARLLHGDAVQGVRHFHCLFVVSYQQELAYLRHVADEHVEPVDVRVVKRRVDLVQQAERARLYEEYGEYEGRGRKRLLSAREKGYVLKPLSGRLRDYLNACLEYVRI